jgi:hypothetical protein
VEAVSPITILAFMTEFHRYKIKIFATAFEWYRLGISAMVIRNISIVSVAWLHIPRQFQAVS